MDIERCLKIDALKAKRGKAVKKIDEIKKSIHKYVTLSNKITKIDDDFDMDSQRSN